MNNRFWWGCWLGCMALAIILAFDWLPILRGGEIFRWQWNYLPVPLLKAFGLLLGIVVFVGVGWVVAHKGRTLTLIWAIFGACVLPLGVTALRYDMPVVELFHRTISPVTTGQHLIGARIDWSDPSWHDWATAMVEYRDVSIHVALSPPGLPMLYGGLDGLLEGLPALSDALQRPLLNAQCHNQSFIALNHAERASAWVGILMPLWAGLAVLPLYALCKRFSDELIARRIALLWALIPAASLFTPTFNTLYPLLALIVVWLLFKGLESKRGIWWWLSSGVLMGILTFLNFSLVPLAMLCGFITLFYCGFTRTGFLRAVWVGGWYGLGVAFVWGIYGLSTGSDALNLLSVAFDEHLTLDRPYLPWLWMHFWEWVLLAGIPITLLWLVNVRHNLIGRALLFTMLILLLSNTARGETARVWLFFTPFMLIGMSSLVSLNNRRHWVLLLSAQVALLVVLASTWDVITAPDIRPRPQISEPIANAIPINANFGDFHLVGWQGEFVSEGLQLTLNWHSDYSSGQSLFFSALQVAPDGSTPYSATVWQPTSGYLTTCWQKGETLSDTILLPMDNPQSGEWYISLSAFVDINQPMERLAISLADGTTDTQVGIGGVKR
jgi:hypothetical protein